MTLDQLKAAYERAAQGREKARLDMLANDGAMQGIAMLIAEEEASLQAAKSQPAAPEPAP